MIKIVRKKTGHEYCKISDIKWISNGNHKATEGLSNDNYRVICYFCNLENVVRVTHPFATLFSIVPTRKGETKLGAFFPST